LCHHLLNPKMQKYMIVCVFGMAVTRIDFDRIKFKRNDFG